MILYSKIEKNNINNINNINAVAKSFSLLQQVVVHKQVTFFACCEFRPFTMKHKKINVPAVGPLLGPTALLINTLQIILSCRFIARW